MWFSLQLAKDKFDDLHENAFGGKKKKKKNWLLKISHSWDNQLNVEDTSRQLDKLPVSGLFTLARFKFKFLTIT